MSLPSYAVTFRGRPACPCQVEWLPAYELEAQRRGFLEGSLPISQLIGGYVGSGGTHASGGADDLHPLTNVKDVAGFLWLGRQMGADAGWVRPYNWDGDGGVEHIHQVLRGCEHNGPARYQIDAVDDGYNGLGSGGRGAPDPGPRPLSGRTWRQGIEWARQQQEEDMPSAEEIAQAVWNHELTTIGGDEVRAGRVLVQTHNRSDVGKILRGLQQDADTLLEASKDDATKTQARRIREGVNGLQDMLLAQADDPEVTPGG